MVLIAQYCTFNFFLSHPVCSPNLAPSDFHLFGPLKDALRERRLADDDDELQQRA
jgi:hypothetical protein